MALLSQYHVLLHSFHHGQRGVDRKTCWIWDMITMGTVLVGASEKVRALREPCGPRRTAKVLISSRYLHGALAGCMAKSSRTGRLVRYSLGNMVLAHRLSGKLDPVCIPKICRQFVRVELLRRRPSQYESSGDALLISCALAPPSESMTSLCR